MKYARLSVPTYDDYDDDDENDEADIKKNENNVH